MLFDEATLNVGLDLAMEFGEDWLQPIQARLGLRYPTLGAAELSAYDKHCRAAMNFGHRVVAELLRDFGGPDDSAHQLFSQRVLSKYGWVSQSNLERLFSQGCYYAMK